MRFEKETLEPEFQPVALIAVFQTVEELNGFVNGGATREAAVVAGLRAQGKDHLLEQEEQQTYKSKKERRAEEEDKPAPKQSSSEMNYPT